MDRLHIVLWGGIARDNSKESPTGCSHLLKIFPKIFLAPSSPATIISSSHSSCFRHHIVYVDISRESSGVLVRGSRI